MMEDPVKNIKRKRKSWSDEDEKILLNLWEENISELRKCRRNSHIYAKMAEGLSNHSPEEIHIKINNFTQRYRSEKKTTGISGGSPSTWKHYDRVYRMLGSFKCNKIELMEESYLFDVEESQSMSIPDSPTSIPSSPLISPTTSTPSPLTTSISPPLLNPSPPLRESSPPPVASSPPPDTPVPSTSTSSGSMSRRSERKKLNVITIQKEALKIAKENQELLREQISLSQDIGREQLTMLNKSLNLLEENTKNSVDFASKIIEISQQQLELEKNFMNFMKEAMFNK